MKILLLTLFTLFAVGCGRQLDDYVRGAPPTLVQPAPPSGGLDNEGKLGLRVSPGHVISTSTHLGMKAGILPTQQSSAGATVGARIGLSRAPARNL